VLKSPLCFNTIYVATVEVVELQCFFNKSGALAPQSV
jgi:hypothetical protein